MMTVRTVDEPAVEPETIPEQLRDIQPLDIANAMEQEINLTINIDSRDRIIMGINGIHHDHAEAGMRGHLHVAPADTAESDEHATHRGDPLIH